ncbi:lipoprotein BA_5634 family protein [Paenibacillus tuaregi]|uniref:lipoprotein BA_5634 family protein n=1 Tax=Paenibacillus tuaregi TaxID=1816681 RepID=UPI0021CC37C5|nr:lipoprotein BA_5634 family protein [Paenibacillus tuaregi]
MKYSVITRSIAEQFIKKGIIRARQNPGSTSLISEPVTDIKEFSNGQNLFFSSSDADMKNNQIDLKGQMVPVQYVKRQAWIKDKVNKVFYEIRIVYAVTDEQVNFVDVQD